MSDSPRTVFNRAGTEPERDPLRRSSADSTRIRGRAAAITHPPATLISAFVDRAVPDREQARIMEHLADCTQCRELVKSTSPRIDFGVRARHYAWQEQSQIGIAGLTSWSGIRRGMLAAIAAISIATASYWTVKRTNLRAARKTGETKHAGRQAGLISSHPAAPEQSRTLAASLLPGAAIAPSHTLPQRTTAPARISDTPAGLQAQAKSSASQRQRRTRKTSHSRTQSQGNTQHPR
jgi:hypothetical protein